MRSTLILLVLACATAFCQDTATPSPGDASQRLNQNLRPRIGDILNAQQLQRLRTGPAPQSITATAITPPVQVCSIPLLNVTPPGKPVAMPTIILPGQRLSPPNLAAPRGAQTQLKAPGPIDHMSVVAPAPACLASATRSTP